MKPICVYWLFLVITPVMAADDSFVVDPLHLWSQPGQVHEVVVRGGVSPFHWQVTAGQVEPVSGKFDVFRYQAPRRYMQDIVLFRDQAGQVAQLAVDVLSPLQVSPSFRHIAMNTKGYFLLQGGSGQWQVIADEVFVVRRLGNQLEVVVGDGVVGFYEVLVRDEVTHEEVKANVQVYAPLEVREIEQK